MAAFNPYLNFNGNTEAVFNFYKSVFGGEFKMLMRFKDVPPEFQMNPGEGDKIMHIALPVGQGNMLMGSDVPEAYGRVTYGSNFNICVNPDSEAEADRLFNSLSDGGVITMPLQKTFWGAYFGMCTDKYGVQWMISYETDQAA